MFTKNVNSIAIKSIYVNKFQADAQLEQPIASPGYSLSKNILSANQSTSFKGRPAVVGGKPVSRVNRRPGKQFLSTLVFDIILYMCDKFMLLTNFTLPGNDLVAYCI